MAEQETTETTDGISQAEERIQPVGSTAGRAFTSEVARARFGPKRVVLVVAAIVGILLAVLAIGPPVEERPVARAIHTVCSEESLSRAGAAIAPVNAAELGRIVQEVRKTPGYVHDQNCMYLVTLYYASVNDTDHAIESWEGFKKVYNPERAIHPALLAGEFNGPQKLQAQVDLMKQLQAEANDNAEGGDGMIRPVR